MSQNSIDRIVERYPQEEQWLYKYINYVASIKRGNTKISQPIITASEKIPHIMNAMRKELKYMHGKEIELYRGLSFNNAKKGTLAYKVLQNELGSYVTLQDIKTSRRAVFEWTHDKEVALDFARENVNGIVFKAKIPLANILYDYDMFDDTDVYADNYKSEAGVFVHHNKPIKAQVVYVHGPANIKKILDYFEIPIRKNYEVYIMDVFTTESIKKLITSVVMVAQEKKYIKLKNVQQTKGNVRQYIENKLDKVLTEEWMHKHYDYVYAYNENPPEPQAIYVQNINNKHFTYFIQRIIRKAFGGLKIISIQKSINMTNLIKNKAKTMAVNIYDKSEYSKEKLNKWNEKSLI